MQQRNQRTIPVAENGRMNLPADMRRALGLHGAGRVIATLDNDEIRITTVGHAVKRVRALAAPYKPSRTLASDELIAQRRQEARREDTECGGADDD